MQNLFISNDKKNLLVTFFYLNLKVQIKTQIYDKKTFNDPKSYALAKK